LNLKIDGGTMTICSRKANKLFLSIFTFILVCSMFVVCFAFNEAHVAQLISTKQCKWCNLQNADFAGAQLPGAEISNSSLTNANLSKANLSRANLSGSFLMNANLSGANFTDAFLANANLSNADLTGTDFSGADLSGVIWTDGTKCEKKSIGECKQSDLLGKAK
jgi:uncharacterized protein YjbI with pentapeptide repeats